MEKFVEVGKFKFNKSILLTYSTVASANLIQQQQTIDMFLEERFYKANKYYSFQIFKLLVDAFNTHHFFLELLIITYREK